MAVAMLGDADPAALKFGWWAECAAHNLVSGYELRWNVTRPTATHEAIETFGEAVDLEPALEGVDGPRP